MIPELIKLNNPQLISIANNPKSEVDIWGRGTGKSFIVGWEMNKVSREMPRSICSITGQTYGQLLTRTLPSTFKFLEPVLKYENFISFSNGTGFLMLSQERIGSSRGPNVDREIVDEALTINKERYDQETSPTNRGNEEHFGIRCKNPIKQHHGFRYVSSMPFMPEQKWLLQYADYYEEEAGIRLFEIWNRIVKLQLDLISAYKNSDRAFFKSLWNEIIRLKQKITPFTSKSGVLFTLANAFDNIENLGMSYIVREYDKQALLTFLIEILNWVIDRVENCYYHIDNTRHVYYSATNDAFIQSLALNSNYDFEKLGKHNSQMDLDCNPNAPLEVCPDWGAKISLFSVGQERNFNFVNNMVEPVDCVINEFYVKPDESSGVMIDDLVDDFCQYYENHIKKEVIYFRDRYGDHRQPNAKNSKPYNEQAIDRFIRNKWVVRQQVHKGMEPPQHEKYLLWLNILKGENSGFPKVIFNGKNCKYTLISMTNTGLRETNGKFEKDKRSEQRKSVLPEEATHFGDAVDKRIWTKYGSRLHRQSTFVDPRF
jgi:hypothetical protein